MNEFFEQVSKKHPDLKGLIVEKQEAGKLKLGGKGRRFLKFTYTWIDSNNSTHDDTERVYIDEHL